MKNKKTIVINITGIVLASIFVFFISACCLSNLTNAIYYNHISDGVSEVTPTSYNDGYVSRWDRLDYTKQNTQEEKYNLNAWRFNSEWRVHMYGWFVLKPFYTGKSSDGPMAKLAYRAQSAEVDANLWDPNWYIQVAGIVMGIFGI